LIDQTKSCGREGLAAGIIFTSENQNQMKTKTLQDLFLDELADMYDAEKRIVKALPKMARAATCTDLKAAMDKHLKETEGHVRKLEQVFQAFGEKAVGKTCEATKGLLEEGDEIAEEFKDSPAINAALIAAAQKVEHYEMASYGCLHEWAGLLGNQKAAGLLEDILNEEKAANEGLTELARASSNEEALGGSADQDADEATEKKAAKPTAAKRPMTASAR
jgi:ferritin-like metal-binding protein YciE